MDTSAKAVIAAAASGDEGMLKAVLAAKGDASCQDETTGLSPLMAAAAAGHGMIVSLLLQVMMMMMLVFNRVIYASVRNLDTYNECDEITTLNSSKTPVAICRKAFRGMPLTGLVTAREITRSKLVIKLLLTNWSRLV